MAIINFKDKGTEYINYGKVSKEALRVLPKKLHRKAQVKLARLGAISSMKDLLEIKGNRFEKLKGVRKGQYSIRINDQYRFVYPTFQIPIHGGCNHGPVKAEKLLILFRVEKFQVFRMVLHQSIKILGGGVSRTV